MSKIHLLLDALREPRTMAEQKLADWDVLLQAARGTQVLSRLAADARRAELNGALPAEVGPHLETATVLSARHEQVVRWELNRIDWALKRVDTPVILLKGAAYLAAKLPASRGRLYNDVDILVPKEKLHAAERALLAHGWEVGENLPHDEEYFRRWLHELLPMVHRHRRTMLDLHHNILPRIDNLCFDPPLLFERAVPAAANPRFLVLAPEDMVIHNCVHLFRNGHFWTGLRDLVDLRDLLNYFVSESEFWPRLVARVEQLRVGTPCYFALRYAQRYLALELPPGERMQIERWKPLWPPTWAMDRLVHRAILPGTPDRDEVLRSTVNWVLERYPLFLVNKTILPKLQRLLPKRSAQGQG